MIVLVDFGTGNLRSILYKLNKIGIDVTVSSKTEDTEKADKLILPGVGAFGAGMNNLNQLGMVPILHRKVLIEKIPILGICLGMHLFTKASEEGSGEGLAWIDAEVKRFDFQENREDLRIPHVGWNTIDQKRDSLLLKGVLPQQRFYFKYSYHVCCHSNNDIIATTHYGYDFVSVIQHENIFGVQFHPEKSHRRGLKIIKNFIELI